MLFLLAADPPPPEAASDAATVTTAWMAGVVGIMLLFGIIALVGYVKQRMTTQKSGD